MGPLPHAPKWWARVFGAYGAQAPVEGVEGTRGDGAPATGPHHYIAPLGGAGCHIHAYGEWLGQALPGTLGVSLGVRRPILSPSQIRGSYLRPTTRSFIGMIALSVILMCSGHTSVQHLVMLQ